ncbi:LLM class flavin-dependent oxidoreductase [Microbacterium rhizomatis]|uniref:LLM class flavin-dependent oxidoreductase n=1 Tax=Microbacterium rhizomatis TaxID=1631477 RepID=A0A5J5J2E2_9MICO|nr:LLM class flavin-dependent oxidoreductase [Microbacterium rhizomatis]KAA9108204.1 LLM class flavin-dependent oxidoreductase [Microbacterium rhizomatis]
MTVATGMSPEVGLACALRPTGDLSLRDALHQAARAAQDSALASWWAPGDREVLDGRSHDATLALHVVVTSTTTLRVGLSGDIPSLYSAPVRAKQIATLDWFSGGRLEHGIDLAPPPAPLADPLRQDPEDHLGQAIDQTAAMHALWTQSRAGYSGPFVSFEGAIALPKPIGDRIPVTHLRATSADSLARYRGACATPAGWMVWSPRADDVKRSADVLTDVLGDAAHAVRRTWVVPADAHPAALDAAQQLGVDEVVAFFDHIPTPDQITAMVK